MVILAVWEGERKMRMIKQFHLAQQILILAGFTLPVLSRVMAFADSRPMLQNVAHDDSVSVVLRKGTKRHEWYACEFCGVTSPGIPFASCWYCGDEPSWHHGRCCPRKPVRRNNNYDELCKPCKLIPSSASVPCLYRNWWCYVGVDEPCR